MYVITVSFPNPFYLGLLLHLKCSIFNWCINVLFITYFSSMSFRLYLIKTFLYYFILHPVTVFVLVSALVKIFMVTYHCERLFQISRKRSLKPWITGIFRRGPLIIPFRTFFLYDRLQITNWKTFFSYILVIFISISICLDSGNI